MGQLRPRELITVVDEHDTVIGAEERQIVRQKQLIHRIVRVIINNSEGQILMQQRPATMEDSPSRWDWSATGHVDADEDYLAAALRETSEEINITDAQLKFVGKYFYETDDTRHLRRFNAVFVGSTQQEPRADPTEVAAIRWVTQHDLLQWFKDRPADFTPSVQRIYERYGSLLFANS